MPSIHDTDIVVHLYGTKALSALHDRPPKKSESFDVQISVEALKDFDLFSRFASVNL
jgi:hypothetical protein